MRALGDAALARLREAADAPDLTGTKYELRERIGQGGMGSVYRVYDRELGRDVALKVIRLPEAAPDVAARMRREARTVARLEHPGVVPVHDVGTLADGRTYYAMKLVRGVPLDALPATTTRADRLRIIERLCEAVAFAHAHGVIHRDLKPQNVMVGPYGEVLVMDWGVAKVPDEPDASLGTPSAGEFAAPDAPAVPGREGVSTHPGTVLGTPGYMAPEQAAGQQSLVDARADVYAVGAILRDLCGRPGDDDEPASPRLLRAIIATAMAPDPADRYPTVQALAHDVARYRAGEPVSVYREHLLERMQRVAVRYRTPILLVVAYLVMRFALLFALGR